VSLLGEGYAPTYLRPPYLATNALSLDVLAQLGIHVININIDTKDYNFNAADEIATAVNNYKTGIDAGGNISLSHDPLQYTAQVLVQEMIDYLNSKGLKCKTRDALLF
jgi:peptidoglycan/xylan/chitin deacetylase (PgdA/CDA1 family)